MWTQVIVALLGIWLMVAPSVFDFSKKISDNAHIAGPLIASFATIAIWECTRNVRFFNVPLALWLLAAPWVLIYDDSTAIISDYAVSVLVLTLTFIRRKRKYRFGGGWSAIWKQRPLHVREAVDPGSFLEKDR